MTLILRVRTRALFPCLALALVAAGCHRQQTDKDVLAEVNGDKILRSEVDKEYTTQTAGSPRKLSPQEDQVLRLSIVHQLINGRLQLQRAQKMGITVADDDVAAKLNQAKAPYTKEEFEKRLKDLGLTEDDYKQQIRRSITLEKLQNKEISSQITVSDADIQNFYNENKAQFNLPEPRYRLAHIFATSQPGPQNDAQALKRIQMIYNRLESGEDFAAVATRYSEDSETAGNGGGMGAVPESQLIGTDAATRDAVLKLKPGQYSAPLAVVNPQNGQHVGYRIVRLLSKDAAGQRELNDPAVQSFIRQQLVNQREQVLKTAYAEVLLDGAVIHNYYAQQVLKEGARK